MLSAENVVTGLTVFRREFKKSEPVFVAGRPFHGLTLRLSGCIGLSAGGVRLISEPGCITYIPQGMGYETEILESGEMIAVHFTTLSDRQANVLSVFRPEHMIAFRNQFLSLHERYKVGRERDYACMAMFYEILASLEYERTRDARAAVPRRMKEAKDYIDHRFGEAALSVSTLAEAAGVSEVYFRKEFRVHFGMSPMAYIKRTRIENARLLLRTGYFTVGEVAAQCGFESLSYFSYEFHRMTGMTPGECIREQKVEE